MLNLLPPETRKRQHAKSSLYSLSVVYIIIVAVLFLGAGALGTWQFVLQNDINMRNEEISRLRAKKEAQSEVVLKAAFIEDRMSTAGSFQEDQKWEEVLGDVAQATPTDVQLSSIKVTTKPTQVLTVGGSTTNARAIVLFRDKLGATSRFKAAAISSISENKTDTSRVFTFTIEISIGTSTKEGN
ncbi:MAG: PilN domain-containing protein [Candidatus Berkelbacteria bacterium]|nr:MAG: PilN domain-containing protein [Candidatus Berkelbacteria bacterium]QQG51580.1 MAG: PilN domain-containing protein [Candidatus Berkelbacteria bacterium]